MGGSSSDTVMGRAYSILMADIVEGLMIYSKAGIKLKQLRDLEPRTTIMAMMGAFSGVANIYLAGALPREKMIDTITEFIAEGILTGKTVWIST